MPEKPDIPIPDPMKLKEVSPLNLLVCLCITNMIYMIKVKPNLIWLTWSIPQVTLISLLRLLLPWELPMVLWLLLIPLKVFVFKPKLCWDKLWEKKSNPWLWLTKSIDPFWNWNWTEKLCIKISLELLIWLMLLSLLIKLMIWENYWLTPPKDPLLSVPEKNVGPLLLPDLPESMPPNSKPPTINCKLNSGEITSLMLKLKNGRKKPKVKMEALWKEPSLNSSWTPSVTWPDPSWKETKPKWKKCWLLSELLWLNKKKN